MPERCSRLMIARSRSDWGVQPVADRRREVCRQVEDDALLAKCRSRCAARGHLLIRMQVGNLLHRPKERETLPVHKRGRLGLQHLLESDARARHVARAFGDEPLK